MSGANAANASNANDSSSGIGTVENHRNREKGLLVYPVNSRRSGGLSIGINLFPDRKVCLFDCAYCEVFPFNSDNNFSLEKMEGDLLIALSEAKAKDIPVKDICFSGNGEPTQSPFFASALREVFKIRNKHSKDADLVLITNGTGLLYKETFELLSTCAREERGLHIWLKIDGGTPHWYAKMNRSQIPHESILNCIRDFSKTAPIIIQTMICMVDEEAPSPVEAKAWEALIREIAVNTYDLRAVQIYGKARPASEDPLASSLPVEFLEARADSLRAVLAAAGKDINVRVYP